MGPPAEAARRTFTSEAVAEGHPDKVADRISDEIVDALLTENSRARAAVEVLVTRDLCVVAGEIAGAHVDVDAVVRRAVGALGYSGEGFDPATLEVQVRLQRQSVEIANAVEDGGAGDQGIVFGYATDETPSFMPAALLFANRILESVATLRRRGAPLGPDGKSQVSLVYENERPVRVDAIVLSHQHEDGLTADEVRALLAPVLKEVFPEGWLDRRTRLLINPSGSFVSGGPAADTGLTGRKVVVDTYGGAAPHGGGAFSGKDPTKVDRSAAYAARWLAKNVVAAGLARRCTLQLAYAIGVEQPLAIHVDTHGTSAVSDSDIESALRALGSLSQRAIRARLQLDRPIYAVTSAYGHFGCEPSKAGHFTWEKLDLMPRLQELLGDRDS